MIADALNRPLADLRVSVTDRCNFRCSYCMPQEEYAWIEKESILTFEEITRLARVFTGLGVKKIRLTGGEPLLRKDLDGLIRQLNGIGTIQDLSLTTNGALLAEQAQALKAAGLNRLNVSLDTLKPATFSRLTKRDGLPKVLEGLEAAKSCGFASIKINTVVIRDVNDGEILELAEFSRANGYALRFIEYMDVGNANHWSPNNTVSKDEILAVLRGRYELEPSSSIVSAPERVWNYKDGGGSVGVIASVTEPFCSSCVRARLTADGRLVTCLFSRAGWDVKALLRGGANDLDLSEFIESVWSKRTDRYSEERWAALKSRDYHAEDHPKIEMITLGG